MAERWGRDWDENERESFRPWVQCGVCVCLLVWQRSPCPLRPSPLLSARPHRIQSSFCWRRKNDEISTEGAESVLLIGGVVSVVTHKCSRYCCYDHNENRTAEVELFWDYYLVCNASLCSMRELAMSLKVNNANLATWALNNSPKITLLLRSCALCSHGVEAAERKGKLVFRVSRKSVHITQQQSGSAKRSSKATTMHFFSY